MELPGFDSLVTSRKQLASALRANPDVDLPGLLVGIYSDPAHFLYELVQNAEDEGARFVEFALYPGRLVVRHDGEDFTLDDVRGITGYGGSTKRDDLTQLGRFGVGFKSVFAITASPTIHSGPFHFRVADFVVPVRLPTSSVSTTGTTIELPFDNENRSSEEAYRLVLSRLGNLGADMLLFLEHVREVRWTSPEESGSYRRDEFELDRTGRTKRAVTKRVVIRSEGSPDESFLRISEPVDTGKWHRSVAVAFRLETGESGRERVVPEPHTPLYVFFPTAKDTNLSFRVQGPFRTTVSRENVPLDEKDNGLILGAVARLAGRSLLFLKKLGYLDVEAFRVLPLEVTRGQGKVYERVREAIIACLNSNRILPTEKGFAAAGKAALAETTELSRLLAKRDLQELFGRSAWLHSSITPSSNSALWSVLTEELGIPAVRFDGLVRRLDVPFLEQKSDHWFVRFYRALSRQRALWAKKSWGPPPALRSKPFIRTEDGTHVAPFDDQDRPRVYLPSRETSEFPIVRRAIVRNREARAFLEALGLTEPDLVTEVYEQILPLYSSKEGEVPHQYVEDFQKLIGLTQLADERA